MEDDVFNLQGHTLEGKYQIEETIARGGFGVVYKALHKTLNCAVAVKALVVPPEVTAAERARFMDKFADEPRLIASLQHPAIVRVMDFGVSEMPSGGRTPWIVLEWIAGETLTTHLRARRGRGGRSPAEALALLRPVFEAIAYAHEQGVFHRDVKPGNMMFSMPVEAERRTSQHLKPTLRLLDFGIAKVIDLARSDNTEPGPTTSPFAACSLPYAAREQILGGKTSPRTDVHALGLILTEVLTDAPPYPGRDKWALTEQVLATNRPTPAARGVDVGAWEAVIARATALHAEDRYRDAGEFLAALDESMPTAEGRASEPAPPSLEIVVEATGPIAPTEPAPTPAPPPPLAAQAPAVESVPPTVKSTSPVAASRAPRHSAWKVLGGVVFGAMATLWWRVSVSERDATTSTDDVAVHAVATARVDAPPAPAQSVVPAAKIEAIPQAEDASVSARVTTTAPAPAPRAVAAPPLAASQAVPERILTTHANAPNHAGPGRLMGTVTPVRRAPPSPWGRVVITPLHERPR